jgi:hypothetical protein
MSIEMSLTELVVITVGALLGATINELLSTRGLEIVGFFALLVPAGISLGLSATRRLVGFPNHRLYDLFEKALHWLLGGVGGAFIGLLVTGAPGLYAVSPPLALFAVAVFLVGIGIAIFLLNVPKLTVTGAVVDEQLLGWKTANEEYLKKQFSEILVVGTDQNLPRGISDRDLAAYCKSQNCTILTCDRKMHINFFADGTETVRIQVYGTNNERSNQTIYSIRIV